jgi:hypothetical protein
MGESYGMWTIPKYEDVKMLYVSRFCEINLRMLYHKLTLAHLCK